MVAVVVISFTQCDSLANHLQAKLFIKRFLLLSRSLQVQKGSKMIPVWEEGEEDEGVRSFS